MKLFLISNKSFHRGYDTYGSAVVAAETEDAAKLTHPGSNGSDYEWDGSNWIWDKKWIENHSWTNPENVIVEYIGETHLPADVICASFNRA
jgi:hypothetical protein